METNKHIRITEAPDIDSAHPIWPGYTALWTVAEITAELEDLITFRGHDARTVIDFGEVVKLVTHIVDDYNKALSKAQFELWATEGMLKGLSSL